MAFFSDGQNRIRLLILYTVKCFRTPVTREQVFTALSAADGADYFTVCDVIAGLEDEQYLLSVPVRGQQLLCITEKGEELSGAFEVEIARSVRDEITGETDRMREEVRRLNSVTADARPLPDGTWELTFSIRDKDSAVFSMTVRMPDAASAARAERKWLREADDMYLDTYKRLIEG